MKRSASEPGLTSSKMVIFFVCLVPVRFLLTSKVFLYHVADQLQRVHCKVTQCYWLSQKVSTIVLNMPNITLGISLKKKSPWADNFIWNILAIFFFSKLHLCSIFVRPDILIVLKQEILLPLYMYSQRNLFSKHH